MVGVGVSLCLDGDVIIEVWVFFGVVVLMVLMVFDGVVVLIGLMLDEIVKVCFVVVVSVVCNLIDDKCGMIEFCIDVVGVLVCCIV